MKPSMLTRRFPPSTPRLSKQPGVCLLCLLLVLLGACGNPTDDGSATLARGDGVSPGAQALEPAEPPDAGISPEQVPQRLLVWAPPFLAGATEADSEAALATAISRFERETGVGVQMVPKSESGRSGLLAYLRSASRAAPSVLPDLIVLSGEHLWQAVDEDLLSPLEETEGDILATLLPVAISEVSRDGAAYAIPYLLDLDHLAYNAERVALPPATIDGVLAQDNPYLFIPGTGEGHGATYLLILYLSAGGDVAPDPENRLQALETAFTFLQQARQRAIIPDDALDLAGAEAVWSYLVNGETDMANVSASLFAAHRTQADAIGYAPMPTADGEPLTVLRSWNFVVLAHEPERRQLALDFLGQLLAPDVQGEWSRMVGFIPSQSAAFETWDRSDPYRHFLSNLLNHAFATPNGEAFAEFLRALQQAQRALLEGDVSVPELLTDFAPEAR